MQACMASETEKEQTSNITCNIIFFKAIAIFGGGDRLACLRMLLACGWQALKIVSWSKRKAHQTFRTEEQLENIS